MFWVRTTPCHYVNNCWTTSKMISFPAVNRQRAMRGKKRKRKPTWQSRIGFASTKLHKDPILRLDSNNYKSAYRHQVWWKSFLLNAHGHWALAKKRNLWNIITLTDLFILCVGRWSCFSYVVGINADKQQFKENFRYLCFLEHFKFFPLTCNMIFFFLNKLFIAHPRE